MRITALIAPFVLFCPVVADAVVVDFNLTAPQSASGESGYFADAYNFLRGGVNLRVSAWSSGGDSYDPHASLLQSRLGVFSSYGMGVEDERGLSHTVDNLGNDFDFLMFEFDREVSIEGLGLSYIEGDSDVSIGALEMADLAPVDNVYDATMGFNAVDAAATASSIWLVGAFHPAFGLAQDELWDGFKIDQVAVNVNPVPLPAAFWLLATGLLAFAYLRRRAAA